MTNYDIDIALAISAGATLDDLYGIAGLTEEELEDDSFEDEWEPDWDIEEGFDPYMGDYSWDC